MPIMHAKSTRNARSCHGRDKTRENKEGACVDCSFPTGGLVLAIKVDSDYYGLMEERLADKSGDDMLDASSDRASSDGVVGAGADLVSDVLFVGERVVLGMGALLV